MKRNLLLGLVVVLLLLLTSYVWPIVSPSRQPYPGCHWKPFQSGMLGVRMLIQDCLGADHYDFSIVNNEVARHRPSNDTIYGSYTLVRVYEKPAGQAIEKALKEQFIDNLPSSRRATCTIENSGTPGSLSEHYFILPNDERVKEINNSAGTDIPDYSECGLTSDPNSGTYFEYQPTRTTARFLYVVKGQDDPLFDEKSIELFTPDTFSIRTLLYPYAITIGIE